MLPHSRTLECLGGGPMLTVLMVEEGQKSLANRLSGGSRAASS